ncbi:MAG: hypothetical protein WC238_01945 [Parcubacteria group bacterium]|jgi:hypothetical protein
MTWLSNNIIGIIGIIISGIIAYHVYYLSRRLNLKGMLSHKDYIRKQVEPILQSIRQGVNRKSELVNEKKYLKYYPHDNAFSRHGYTYMAAELKSLRFDGVEFFCGIKEIFKKQNGKLTIQKENRVEPEKYNAFETGIIPYEWIEYVDSRGDEFSYRPQFFVKFKGIEKSPYKYLRYYVESNTYNKANDPIDMKWRSIEIEK